MVEWILCDVESRVVAAWAGEFQEVPAVTVRHGSLFEQEADALVFPGNSFGFMSGGLCLYVHEFFDGTLEPRLRELIRRRHHGELTVGQAEILPTGHAQFPFLVAAPTKRVPQDISGTVNAYLLFRAALLVVGRHNATAESPIRSVVCPGLDTSGGRMPASMCARQMRAA